MPSIGENSTSSTATSILLRQKRNNRTHCTLTIEIDNSLAINNNNFNNMTSKNNCDDILTIDDEDAIMNEEDPNDTKGDDAKNKRRKTSTVWNNYIMLPPKEGYGERCECIHCGKIYACPTKNGTGSLRRHMDVCQRKNTRDIGQLLISQSSGNLTMRSSKFDPAFFREIINNAIVMHELPLQFVEYKGIRDAFLYCHENANLVSRNTAKTDVLKMYKREKIKIKNMLDDACGRISLTTDLWTSLATDGYLTLTAHFIDKGWMLHKRILSFCVMPPPHSGVCLAEKIYSLLSNWGIEKKLFTITLDNASANNSFIEMLRSQLNMMDALLLNGDFLHLRCSAHVLNLIVKDGLKEIEDVVHKIRESVKYVKGSQVRKVKFLECVDHMSLNGKRGLRQDVPTRWNSTFLMLDSAIFYRRAFSHLELSDSNYKHCPSRDDWDKVEKINEFLELFYHITLIFSGSKYPTSNLFFPSVFTACMTLKNKMESEDEFIRRMAISMNKKFEKYWSEFSMILSIAVILDPRYKIQFVEWAYKKLYGNASLEFSHVRSKLLVLFNEYLRKTPCSTSSSSRKRASGVDSYELTSLGKNASVLKEFDIESEEFDSATQKSQLDMYLDEPRFERTTSLDILDFWKSNQYRYPELASMARDILCIPITSVASESAFSLGGRILDKFRSSLKPETVESLVCLKDWMFGDEDKINEVLLEELTEDIFNSETNKEVPQASNQTT